MIQDVSENESFDSWLGYILVMMLLVVRLP